MGNYTAVVIDFETTGLSPEYGDRVIEVGAVLLRDNRVTDSFQSLVNPGRKVSRFIEEYTGITNAMLADAPDSVEVIVRLAEFLGDHYLIAHNASFDRRFLDCELKRIGCSRRQEMACSMLVSRRVYPDAPSHKLGDLVRFCRIENGGVFHRALADAEMTAHLWSGMTEDLKLKYGLGEVPFQLMMKLASVSRKTVQAFLMRTVEEERSSCQESRR
ncbi:PolC-type DNA polymerase III [Geobacter sp. DSM 9736]|uniref:3'-5' exonuclease n=1 Tax=Geobacter sp. DSM 9736 TaxID=1277350 RepID=UPI000B510EBA|nr:3'-5' exonuclease [Geobacter sp. DSM 9736]SNB45674.1 DNA polymerase-3 subunit epsilon [Geobacter sp. DSM 9736]